MAELSLCSVVGENTGGIACDRKKGKPLKLIIGSATFPAGQWVDTATFFTAMTGKINQAAGTADKMFPSPEIQGNTNNSGDNTTGTLGYGTNFVLQEGLPSYSFQIIAGQNQFANLRKFNGVTVPVFVLDDQGAIWGRLDAAGNFAGYSAQIFTSGNGFEDGTTVEAKTATMRIDFISASQFNDRAAFIDGDWAPSDFIGLNNAPLSSVGTIANPTKFQIVVPTANLNKSINLADNYSTELAAAANWKAFTGPTFSTSLAITGVAYNSADKTWSVTFDSTAFTALGAAAKIKVSLSAPSVLFASGVTGIESVAVIITKP